MGIFKGQVVTQENAPSWSPGRQLAVSVKDLPETGSFKLRALIPEAALQTRNFIQEPRLPLSSKPYADLHKLIAEILKPCLTTNYGWTRIGSGLMEIGLPKHHAELPAQFAALSTAETFRRPVDVGYRSTRVDMAGNPITKPRQYLGVVSRLEREHVVLETHFGPRKLLLAQLAWVNMARSKDLRVTAFDFTISAMNGSIYLNVEELTQEQVLADDPREIYMGPMEKEPAPFSLEGFDVIADDESAVRRMTKHLRKKRYIEIINDKGELRRAFVARVEKAYWNTGNQNVRFGIGVDIFSDTVWLNRGELLRLIHPKRLPEFRLEDEPSSSDTTIT